MNQIEPLALETVSKQPWNDNVPHWLLIFDEKGSWGDRSAVSCLQLGSRF